MVFQDEYYHTIHPSPLLIFTPEATTLINHTLVGSVIPFLLIGTILPEQALLGLALLYCIPGSIPSLSVLLQWDTYSLGWPVTSIFHLIIHTPHSALLPCDRCSLFWAVPPLFYSAHYNPLFVLLCWDRCCLIWTFTPVFHSVAYIPLFQCFTSVIGAPQFPPVHLHHLQYTSLFPTHPSYLCAPLSLGQLLPFCIPIHCHIAFQITFQFTAS